MNSILNNYGLPPLIMSVNLYGCLASSPSLQVAMNVCYQRRNVNAM
jgi:hypothetical protein